MPAVKSAPSSRLITWSCQTAPASPKPTSASEPSVQALYMNVMWRRGRPRWPRISAARIEPTPPQARTSPKSPALPPSSFRTRYGTSTSIGPQ